MRLTLVDGWYLSRRELGNAVELVTPKPEESGGVPDARILVTYERRRSHEEALLRLRQIAQEAPVQTRREIRYAEIAGWPAMLRRYKAPLEHRGQEEDPTEPPVSELRPAVGLRVTIAIAAGDLLLRLDGDLAPGTDPARADDVEAIAARLELPAKGDLPAVEKEIRSLEVDGPTVRLDRDRIDRASRRVDASGADLARAGRPVAGAGGSGAGVGAPVNVQTGRGELEVAVSADGQNVVIGANPGFSFSNDGGVTYTFGGGTPALFPRDGDPSLAWGQSGTFYYGFIGFPNGTPAANNVSGCSTGISSSTNNGATFTFQNHAVLCPLTGPSLCFPDQEHIAADRFNAGSGGDQVYSVWRNFTPSGSPASCNQIGSGFVTPSIVCSQDGAATWTATAAIGSGDFPRVTVGSDGTVYVAYRQGGNVMLHRFSSCAAGLTPQVGFPVVVAAFTNVPCPVPGLDRRNDGNLLTSPMVAVDDTDPSHVFVAFATGSGAGNENVVVRDSPDGGATWTGTAVLSSAATGRRFMPWVCSVGGQAFVSWYDRRVATPATLDRTDFFVGSAAIQGGVLQPGVEANLSVNADPQCATGWPATDTRVLEDNNKAQRNMGLSTTPATGAGTGFSGFAIAHNAATFRRDMEIVYEVPNGLVDRVRGLQVGVIGGRTVSREPKGRLVLEGMEPGENRWIGITMEAPKGKVGDVVPVLFTEMVRGTPVNGFGLGARIGSEREVVRDALALHRSVFTRLAVGFQVESGWKQADRALELLRDETTSADAYRRLLKEAIPVVLRSIEELEGGARWDRVIRRKAGTADPFRLAEAAKALEAALSDREIGVAALAHVGLLNALDSDLTRRQLAEGDPADILQTVRWQEELFADRLPRAGVLPALGCSGQLVRASRGFIDGYGRRTLGNDDYPRLVEGALPCLEAAAREAGERRQADLEGPLAEVKRALGSPAALQRAHWELLLRLDALAR